MKLEFTGDTLKISQILLDGVLLTSLAIDHLSILLNILERSDDLNNQLAIKFLEVIKLLAVLLLAFLCMCSSLL